MYMRTLLLLCAVPFLLTACAGANDTAATSDSAAGVAATSATGSDAASAREAIEAANGRIVEAFKRADSVAIVANFADDAVVMQPNTDAWRGRDGIRKGASEFFSQLSVSELSLKTDDVAVGGDLAVETGTYEMTVRPKGGTDMKDKGKYVVVWRRQADGTWKVLRDIHNSDLPAKK